jgi:glutathione S-transferase
MKLVGQYDSVFTRRVAVTLHHYHLPFNRDERSVFGNAAAIQKISPLTRIPALVLEDGEVLIESTAIIDYLDERVGPARALVPPHGAERRRILQATALAHGTAEKAGAVVYERSFHSARCVSKDWEARCLGQARDGLKELEHRCGSPWFFDTQMSHADIMTACLVSYLRLRLPEVFPDGKYPKLHALAFHCEARPEFVAARAAPHETMPAAKG